MEDLQNNASKFDMGYSNLIKFDVLLDKNYVFPGSKLTGSIILAKNKFVSPLNILNKDNKFIKPIDINFCIEQHICYDFGKKGKNSKKKVVLDNIKEFKEIVNKVFEEKFEFPFELTIPENLYPSINIYNNIINQYILKATFTLIEKTVNTNIFIKNTRTYPKKNLLKEPSSKFKEEKIKYSLFSSKEEVDVLFSISSNSIPYNKNINYEVIIDERNENLIVECINVSLFRYVTLIKVDDNGSKVAINLPKKKISSDKITDFGNSKKKGAKIHINKEFGIPKTLIRENNNNSFNENFVENNENIYHYCEGEMIEIKYEMGICVKVLSHCIELYIPFEIYFTDLLIDIPQNIFQNVSRLETSYSSKLLNDSMNSNSMLENNNNTINKSAELNLSNCNNLSDIDKINKEFNNIDDNNNNNKNNDINVPDGFELLDENNIYELMRRENNKD